MQRLIGAVLNHMRASSVDWEAAATTLCTENDVEVGRLDKNRIQALAPAARSEFCLSSAIVGGIAAQEIIKFVTGRGKPMENQFYFDALDPKCENTLLVAETWRLRLGHFRAAHLAVPPPRPPGEVVIA